MATKQETADQTSETSAPDMACPPVAAPMPPAPALSAEAPEAIVPKPEKPVSNLRSARKATLKVAARSVTQKAIPRATKAVAAEPVKRAASASKGTMNMNDIISKFAAEAKARTEAMTAEFSERTKDALANSSKLAEDAAAFNKGNVDAVVASGKIAAKNLETLRDESTSYVRKSFEDSSAAMQSFASVKSPAEFFRLYAENSKKAFDAAVAQTSKSSEMLVKMTSESFEPISNRMAVITSTLKVA